MKLALQTFFTVLVLFPSAGWASCGEILLTNRPLLNDESKSSVIAFRELATMAIYNDKVIKQDSSGFGSLLEEEFNKKRTELRDLVVGLGLMTDEEFELRLAENVAQLQAKIEDSTLTDSLAEREQKDLLKFSPVPDGSQAIFGPVKGGSYMMGDVRNQTLTQVDSFAIMLTPVTQKIWNEIIGLTLIHLDPKNPEVLKSSKVNLFGDLYPRTMMPWDILQDWIAALNALGERDIPELLELFPGHRKGDTYRIPTDAEWEFVARNRGALQDDYAIAISEMDDYIPTRDKEIPVARRKSYMVGTIEVYDLFGHVGQVTSADTPPLGDANFVAWVRGGSIHKEKEDLRISSKIPFTKSGNLTVGLRLVRERME